MIPHVRQLREIVLQTERTLPQSGLVVTDRIRRIELLSLRFTASYTDHSASDEFPNVKRLRRFLRQHVEELLRVGRLERRSKILVPAVEFGADIVQRDALVA